MAVLWKLDHAHAQITIDHVAAKDWFYIKYCGHIISEDAIATAKKYLELQTTRNCPKILNDKSEVTGDWQEANVWLQYDWLPPALETGLKYFAMVLSRDLHDLGPSQDLKKRFSPGCEVQLFRDLAQAEIWLESVS